MASLSRRVGVALAGSALAFSLVSVPSAMVATATAQAAADCKSSGSASLNGYEVTNEWLNGGTAAPGGEATLRSVITGPGGLVAEAWQIHPEGFAPVSAKVRSYKFPAGQTWADETVVRDEAAMAARPSGSGWTTAFQSVTVDITYRVPVNAVPGDKLDSGSRILITGGSLRTFDPMGACIAIREPNPVESVQGSLEGIGAGALVEGSVSSSNISSDPSGFLGDTLGGILGGILGGAVNS